jgi:hypothetical protein
MFIEDLNGKNVCFMDEKNKIEASIIKQGTLKECENEAQKFKNIPILKKNVPNKKEIMDYLRERFVSKNISDKENISIKSCSTKSSSDQNNLNDNLTNSNDHDLNQMKNSPNKEYLSQSAEELLKNSPDFLSETIQKNSNSSPQNEARKNSEDDNKLQSQQKLTLNQDLKQEDCTFQEDKESNNLKQEFKVCEEENIQTIGLNKIAPQSVKIPSAFK